MRRFRLIIALLMMVGGIGAGAGAEQTVRVNADRVNLRARPSLQAETVAQVGSGDRLSARQIGDDWVEVAPPDDVAFFVHADFVRDGVVDVARLNVRAGPGINYSDMGALTRGDRVTVIGEFADWLKIMPPAGASVWISREYIDVPEVARPRPEPVRPTPPPPPPPPTPRPTPPEPVRPTPAPTPRPPPAPAPTPPPAPQPAPTPEPTTPPPRPPAVVLTPPAPVAPPRPTPKPAPAPRQPDRTVQPPAALQRMGLVPLPGQGRSATYEGVLTRGSFLLIRPSRYRLIDRGPGRVVTLCYVMGNHAQLDGLDGHDLTVHGREYWVQGVRQPILVVERIERK